MEMIAERYRLDHVVGRGGMGEVWLAEDTVLARSVAIKRIGGLPGASGADLDRVRREAQVSAMLNHEHVVAVFDLVTQDDQPWLVMEYVESENLAELVQRRGVLSPDDTAPLVEQAASALAAAHRAGIVHRDVKPSNLLVTRQGRIKLSDFGIARLEEDQSLTLTGVLVGSPGFLAPEVAAGGVATSASDLWSLGATAFHAVEGRSPYASADGNLIGILYRIVNEPAPRPEHAGWLGPLIEHLMVHDPAGRWSADETVAFLQAGPDASHTQALPVTRAAVPAALGARTPAVQVTQSPSSQSSSSQAPTSAPRPSRRPRRGSLLPLSAVAGLGVLVILAAILALIVVPKLGNGRSGGNPTASPSQSGSATPGPTAATMASFAKRYVATAATKPRQGFDQLTADYQNESGGYQGYLSFWGTVKSAVTTEVRGDPKAMTVGYKVDYTLRNGGHRTESVTLDVIYRDGTYKITGAR